jgi:hypothetical protein
MCELFWKSPWRVIIMGKLSDIVESTLIDDVSKPSVLTNTDWIKPGLADGTHDKNFSTRYMVVDRSGSVDVKLLRRGGFAACLKPLQ